MLNRSLCLVVAFIFTSIICVGQDLPPCEPDSTFLLSDAIVFPDPVIDDTTGIGIYKEACINTPYILPIFLRPPASIVFNGFPIAVTSFKIDSVRNLPAGIEFVCSTPDCVFPTDSVSCIYITGSPTEANDTGVYSLEVDVTAVALGFPISISFPDTSGSTLLPMGRYDLILHEEGNPNCEAIVSQSHDVIPDIEKLRLAPNPTNQYVNIDWSSDKSGKANLKILSLSGQLILEADILGHSGQNTKTIHLEELPSGLYLVKLRLENQIFQNKLLKL